MPDYFAVLFKHKYDRKWRRNVWWNRHLRTSKFVPPRKPVFISILVELLQFTQASDCRQNKIMLRVSYIFTVRCKNAKNETHHYFLNQLSLRFGTYVAFRIYFQVDVYLPEAMRRRRCKL